MRLRTPRQTDIPALADLMHHVWHVHYADIIPAVYVQSNKSHTQCRDELSGALQKGLLRPSEQMITGAYTVDDDKMMGFACMFAGDSADAGDSFFNIHGFDAELERFYVHPDHQRQGVGTKLLVNAATWCHQHNKHSVCLWTFAENTQAHDFYAKHGAKIYKQVSYNYIAREAPLYIMSWDDFPAAILDTRVRPS